MRQTFRLKAGLRARKSGLVSLRKIFLPTRFSYPTLRGSAPMASTHPIPTERQGPAQLNRFPINKTADRGQEDCMGRKISQAAGSRAQNPSILPPKGGTTHSKSGLVRLRKIFLPTKFSCQKFRGSAPMASTHPIPTARQGPAQRNRFPINKTAGSGQEDFMGRAQPSADV